MNFFIYFLLTCELSIWLEFFSYKNMPDGFENFLVLQGYLMGNNIVSMCGRQHINVESLWCMETVILYSLNKFPSQPRILCKQGN
jgi:hypothetical protein